VAQAVGGRHAVTVRSSRGRAVGALVVGALAACSLAACTPSAPDDQTTGVDVQRYQDLAADPWLAATSLTVGRYAFGTNRQFEPGTGRGTRTTTGTLAQVLAAETTSAAREGWVVAAARCGDGSGSGWPVTIELVRALSDGAVAVGEVRVEQDQSGAQQPEGEDAAARALPRRVLVAAYAPHHTNRANLDVPDEPVEFDALECLGGPGGASVGPSDLLAQVQGVDEATR